MTDNVGSRDQQNWTAFARRLISAIAERVPKVAEMTPEEMEAYTDAARQALWLHIDALAFDREVELKLARNTWEE